MIPAEFDYLKASSLEDALAKLAERGEDAKLLAGGHSLLPIMKLRLAQPSALIDIRGLPELTGVSMAGGLLRIGAGVRHRHLERHPEVRRYAPLLAHAAATIGDPQVRSRGTIGGSLAHADPAADLPAVLLASGATLVARSTSGEREIDVADFFTDFWETALRPDEVLTEIRLPSAEHRPYAFQKFSQRAQEWAIVGVAALGGDDARLALINMGSTPIRATAAEQALAAGASVAEASALADSGTSPPSDLRAESDYRRHLSRVLTQRALDLLAS